MLNEGGLFGVPMTSGNDLHDIAIKGSPAFRSFADFERSSLGAKLLMAPESGAPSAPQFQAAVLKKAFGDDWGWLNRDTKEQLINLVGSGKEAFSAEAPSVLYRDFVNNGFARGTSPERRVVLDSEFGLNGMQELFRRAALARRAVQHTPSEYAELKVHGPVSVTAENWAGALLREPNVDSEGQKLLETLVRSGVPVVNVERPGVYREEAAEIARLLQRQAGPARKQPL